MGRRRKARECSLEILYQMELQSAGLDDAEELLASYWQSRKDAQKDIPEDVQSYAEELVLGAMEHLTQIDQEISKVLTHWSLDKISKIDKNIMRSALFELLYKKEPLAVIINESVEVAKKYSSSESDKFVNGILDKVYQNIGAQAC